MYTSNIPTYCSNPNFNGSTSSFKGISTQCALGPVLLYFRPMENYKGEFGFDWMRDGDMYPIEPASGTIFFEPYESVNANNYQKILAGFQSSPSEGTIQALFKTLFEEEEIINPLVPLNSTKYANLHELVKDFYNEIPHNTDFSSALKFFLIKLENHRGARLFTEEGVDKILKSYQNTYLEAAYTKLEEEYNAIPIKQPESLSTTNSRYCKHWLAIFPKVLAQTMNEKLGIGDEYPNESKYDDEKLSIKMQYQATLRVYAKNISNKDFIFDSIESNIPKANSPLLIEFTKPKLKTIKGTGKLKQSAETIIQKKYLCDVTIISVGILEHDTEIEVYLKHKNTQTYVGSIIVCKNDFRVKNWEQGLSEFQKAKLKATFIGTTVPDEELKELIATKLAIKPDINQDGVQLSPEQLNTNYSGGSRRQDIVSVNLIFRAPSPPNKPTNPQTFKGKLDQFDIFTGNDRTNNNSGMIPSLYKGFHQCLLYGKILTIDLDLTNDDNFNTYTEQALTGNNAVDFKKRLASSNVWLIEAHQKKDDKTLYISHETYHSLDEQTKKLYKPNSILLLKDHLLEFDTVNTETADVENPEIRLGVRFKLSNSEQLMTKLTSTLTQFLNNHSAANIMEIKNALQNNSVIIFNAKAISVGVAEGWAFRNSNLTVMCSTLDNITHSSSAAHEALHSVGLFHTFLEPWYLDSQQKMYYFKGQKFTDNIMAYNGIYRGFTWRWQWKSVKVYSSILNNIYPRLP